MRVKIAEFEKKFMPHAFGLFLSRFVDTEKQDNFMNEALPYIEQLVQSAGQDKWLLGTDELTLLDTMAGPIMDFVYVQIPASANSECAARLNIQQNAPNWCAYMERLRAHPKISTTCMSMQAAEKYATRARSWQEGVKCQLAIEVLYGLFSDLP